MCSHTIQGSLYLIWIESFKSLVFHIRLIDSGAKLKITTLKTRAVI